MGYNSVPISHLSLEYVGVPVNAVDLTGAPSNPTADPVVMAFMPQATQVPQLSDWQNAIWQPLINNLQYPYAAYCLVGPGGTIQLGIGTYVVYVKFTGNPVIPVRRAQLQLEIY